MFNREYAYDSDQPLTLEQVGRYAPSALAVRPHESRSSRYTYIPTVDVINALMREGFMPFRATQSRSRVEGKSEFTKHMIRFRHMDLARSIAVGETVPELCLINSHDGTSLYELLAGMFRKICGNGLMVSESTIGSFKVRHSGEIVKQVIEGSYRILESSQKSLAVMNQWQNLQLTSGEQNAFADAAHTLRFADAEGNVDTPITAAQLLTPRRRDDIGDNLWKTFNRVQENTIKGNLSARREPTIENGRYQRGRRVSTRAVQGIDQNVKLNRALWQLAEKMAELKAA